MTTTDIRIGQHATDDQLPGAGPEQATRTDHRPHDDQGPSVDAGTDPRHAIVETTTMRGSRGGHDHPTGHPTTDDQSWRAGGAQTPESTIMPPIPTGDVSARARDTAAATFGPQSKQPSPLPSDSPNGHDLPAAQATGAVGGTDTATPANGDASSTEKSPGVAGEQDQPANRVPDSTAQALADPTLALLADVLDDLERTRIANENRLRQLTRDEPDKDGEERGFGLTEDHPDVARLASVVRGIADLEHQATLNLARVMRAHPLGPWVKAQKGVGEKQAARLLAAIGDPYWHTVEDRPRTVSELWAYCGLHTLPSGHSRPDIHAGCADGIAPGSDQAAPEIQAINVAARRKKGERANWSTAAKMRVWNIAGSMLKAGNREAYDKRKAATEGRLHETPCVRCGPSGKPAQPGSPWSDAHRHADALRIVSKELLKQLWLTARDIHHGQYLLATHEGNAVMDTSKPKPRPIDDEPVEKPDIPRKPIKPPPKGK